MLGPMRICCIYHALNEVLQYIVLELSAVPRIGDVGTLMSLPRLRLPSPSVTVMPIPSIVDCNARLLTARRKDSESQDRQGSDV